MATVADCRCAIRFISDDGRRPMVERLLRSTLPLKRNRIAQPDGIGMIFAGDVPILDMSPLNVGHELGPADVGKV